MRLKSLIAAVALGTGLACTGLAAAAEATTPKSTSSPGHLSPSQPGDNPANSGQPSTARSPGKAIPTTPNYTG
jgi:hypothetical protein